VVGSFQVAKRIRFFSFLTFLIFSLGACGPSQSAQDLEDQQTTATVRSRKAQFAPFVGVYFGKMVDRSGDQRDIYLELYNTTQVILSPTRNVPVEVPTIGGAFAYLITDKNGKKGPGQLMGTFQTGNFDPSTNQIWIYGIGQVATAPINMNLSISGGTISGRYFSPGLLSTFTATRQ
jgi:hypothetical protein